MNKVEVGQLLTIASGFDRFVTVDRVTTESWYLALAPIEYREAQQIVIAYYTGPDARKPLGVHHIIEQVSVRSRVTPQQIEDDVRSAKARGIIAQDWPRSEPLTQEAAAELSAARDRDREEARRYEVGVIEATG